MSSPPSERQRIAIVGGTGPEGRGLAIRLARASHHVTIGSRSHDRAVSAAVELGAHLPDGNIAGASNETAVADADIVILTIPFAGVDDTLAPLAPHTSGKIIVSAIAPVEFQEGRPVALRVEAGSAAQRVQQLLPAARVVSAFQNVDAHQLQDLAHALDTDVVVCSDDQEARRTVVAMINEIPGLRALSGGRLGASRYVEEITALLITLNRIYKVHSGVRFTGIDR